MVLELRKICGFAIAVDDPNFDPVQDYDHETVTGKSRMSIDNGTDLVFLVLSAPVITTKILSSNLNDWMMMEDGILDKMTPSRIW